MEEFNDIAGLSAEEVAAAQASGDVNVDAGVKTRSIKDILYSNIVTLFNIVNVILFLFVLYTGSYKNGLFMIIITCNACIGIIQEIRSKRVTDQLSIVAASKARVIRGGEQVEIAQDEIVRNDIVILGRGDQVPCDSTVVAGNARVDESLLTGESNLIPKTDGATLMSGSFISSGTVAARVEHVGGENYAAKISAEAKKHKAINSQIMNSLNAIIKYVSVALFPVGILLFASMHIFGGVETNEAILSAVAALVGMVPEGLILLTSTVLALAVIRLARDNVLVQQLYCIETLARVDTLCLDKTGTITSGAMEVASIDQVLGVQNALSQNEAAAVFGAIASADPDPNETAMAIIDYCKQQGIDIPAVASYVPFASERKWSGAVLADGRAFVMGAGQFVLKDDFAQIADQVAAAAETARVLVLAQVDGFDTSGETEALIGHPQALSLIAIHDQIRASAAQTIGFFKEQGVDVKVISGDDPRTVSGIAQKVGVPNAAKFVDATTLETDEDIASAVSEYAVFGRVKPEQKKAFVLALQEKGHTVAMTGDGVNDTLALKAADCSVAMAAGSDAARNVAQLVLVDNDFAHMPDVVAEGRRSINNLQRSASLFLVKTVFSMVLAVLFIILPWQYPYQPIQMTLVSGFTIGIPSFVLALEPNHDRIKGRFLENVIVKSLPGSIAVILMVLAVNIIGYGVGMNYDQVSTVCVLLTAWVGVNLIFRISQPFTPLRIALIAFVIIGCVGAAALLPWLFNIEMFTPEMWWLAIGCGVGASAVFHFAYNKFDVWHEKRQAELV